MLDTLKELIFIPGVSGYESQVREFIKARISGKWRVDKLGNLILTLGEGETHLLFIAHMDELGMVVTYIEEDGSLRIRKVGGIDDRTLIGRAVIVHTKKGDVEGVIGIKPPHLMINREEEMKKVIPWNEMYIDVGTASREESRSLGIDILDAITLKKDFVILNEKIVCARGIDDRVGCLILLEALRRVERERLDKKVSFVWSVQEEVGLRGAKVIGNALKPDYAFIIDSCSAADVQGVDFHMSPFTLGKGPALRIIDRMAIATPQLKERIIKIAERHKIPFQLGATGGATDGAVIQTSEQGVQMLPLSIPLRYTHSPVELCHLDDVENMIKLVVHIINELS